MGSSDLLNHLSMFENLISLSPDQLLKTISPYVDLFTSAGRFFIFLLFIIHLTSNLVLRPYNDFKRDFLTDIVKFFMLMAIFGNSLVYMQVCKTGISIFNYLSDHILRSEFVMFKGSFRVFMDNLADQSKQGVDFFNVKSMSASALTLFLSTAISLLLVTYYLFVSFGLFELLVILAIGPVIAGFFFFLRNPFYNWFTGLLASITFPVMSSIAVAIMNQSDLIVNMQDHLIAGSLVTCLLQIILGIGFLQFVIIIHASFWGVSFINVPVKIISIIQLIFGMFHFSWLNWGMIITTRRKAQ